MLDLIDKPPSHRENMAKIKLSKINTFLNFGLSLISILASVYVANFDNLSLILSIGGGSGIIGNVLIKLFRKE